MFAAAAFGLAWWIDAAGLEGQPWNMLFLSMLLLLLLIAFQQAGRILGMILKRRPGRTENAIVAHLEARPISSVNEIAAALGIRPGRTTKAMIHLKLDGMIAKAPQDSGAHESQPRFMLTNPGAERARRYGAMRDSGSASAALTGSAAAKR